MLAWQYCCQLGKFIQQVGNVCEETGLKYVIDSAFCTSNTPFFIKSSQDDLTVDARMLTVNEQMQDIARNREATSMPQSAEWGMLAVQSSFPLLKDTLVYKEYGE